MHWVRSEQQVIKALLPGDVSKRLRTWLARWLFGRHIISTVILFTAAVLYRFSLRKGRKPSPNAGVSKTKAKWRSAVRVPKDFREAEKQFGLADDIFELGEKIDAGGQGTVYMCKRLSTQHPYAVKVINTSALRAEERQLAALRREIRVMRELHHPFIVNLHEAFWREDQCLIVMDLAAGGNLFDMLGQDISTLSSPFPGLGGAEYASRYVASQLLEGISYMQAKNVLHRDLKLENILITGSSYSSARECDLHDIKIADFGLSKVDHVTRASSIHLERTMTAVGTPDYVAPEVLDGKYDERVDFWSFGVILYAMLCGRMPFTIRSLSPELHKEEVARVRDCESWRRVSEIGRDFVMGLLTVDPDQRYGVLHCSEHAWLREVLAGTCPLTLSTRSIQPAGVAECIGVVEAIVGRTAAGVHGVEMQLRDGTLQSHGSDGGVVHTTYSLELGELIVGVMQDFSFTSLLGSALVFYTSRGRIFAIQGTEARTRRRFVAPGGRQISGLQFDGHQLVGIHLEKVTAEKEGAIEQISGRVGSAVDVCEFKLRDGTVHTYGDAGGDMVRGPWHLQPEEWVFVVEQFFRDRKLGASLAFYTSMGRVYKLSGMTAVRSPRFAAPAGEQVCDLGFEQGRLVKVLTCSCNGFSEPCKAHEIET
mmetsp:Transcript_27948/g.65017  ORF Transcript_27948/g.65017 Transcript_27948/m.65017 type:complete len:651 (+) Transcript_27948:44-1996(+)